MAKLVDNLPLLTLYTQHPFFVHGVLHIKTGQGLPASVQIITHSVKVCTSGSRGFPTAAVPTVYTPLSIPRGFLNFPISHPLYYLYMPSYLEAYYSTTLRFIHDCIFYNSVLTIPNNRYQIFVENTFIVCGQRSFKIIIDNIYIVNCSRIHAVYQ